MSNYQCRLCAEFKPLEDLLNISKCNTENLEQKIKECFNLTFENLLLPQHVCLKCSEQVSQSFTFREKVLKAQKNLQPCVLEEKIKSEYPENEPNANVGVHFLEFEHEDAGFKSEDKSISDEDSDFQEPLSTLKVKKKTTQKRKQKAVKTEPIEEDGPKKSKLPEEIKIKLQQTRDYMKNYIWKCTICNKQLPTKRDLRKHYPSSHETEPVYACMECPYTSNVFPTFRVHAITHRDRGRYQCVICSQAFSKNIVLRAHLTTHTAERIHMCSMCGKSFKATRQLNEHRKTHAPDKFRYGCDICGKKMASRSSLLKHQKLHKNIKEYTCEHCGNNFSQRINLKHHIEAIHQNDYAYSCTKCPKRFKTATSLQKHVAGYHREDRKHECKECGKLFYGIEALKHKTVCDALPFQCQLCQKKFKTKRYLTIHMRHHSEERPYSCKDCDRHFIDGGSLNKHMKKRHRLFPISNESRDAKQPLVKSITYRHTKYSELIK